MFIYSPQSFPASPARVVSGQFLAKNRLGARDRAKLAAALLDGRATITGLTVKQAARLCRVCALYVCDARGGPPAATRLMRDWAAADHEARVAFARAVGADSVFDIQPAMTDDPVKGRLSWSTRGNDANVWWALADGGRYFVTLHNGYWNVDHRPWRRWRRQLGMAATANEAKALAQADYYLAREKIRA
jgi:hypothetical protein